ncbi:MAG: AAA family ATPase [Spirochaetales bacterium]|nr:AAA family ATPase [Spirochaetales bacterium]
MHRSLMLELIKALERVIRGKHQVLEHVVTTLVAGGHLLIEDVPGLGKTTLAKTLARLISGKKQKKSIEFKRIQCTPDLLPYDITGVDIYDPDHKTFIFKQGPVFANILLVDEINRTTPKVQSALLEVMAENQVTVGNKTYAMDKLFFVIATQNPLELEGTYPLPVAQIDRFFMKITIGYPDEDIEIGIVHDDPAHKIMPGVHPVCGSDELLRAREFCEKIECDERLVRTIVRIIALTRKHRGVELGASPRCSLMLLKACRVRALLKNRTYVIDQDIIDLAPLVIGHRLKFKDIHINPHEFLRELALAELKKINYQE